MATQLNDFDYAIIGAGIIGMTIAYELCQRYPNRRIVMIEKESDVAKHASGRNSGILHAGFYYHADSLKAKFTVDGNKMMQTFCQHHQIYVNHCRKLVVTKNAKELGALHELYQRGQKNGAPVMLINQTEVHDIDPNASTYQQALYSPSTASVDPQTVCFKLKEILLAKGVIFKFSHEISAISQDKIICKQGVYAYQFLINAAGLYADKVAQQFGIAKDYMILPFKGIYLKYLGDKEDIKTNIYPVPDFRYPFLGVHFTKTVNGEIKIGPTAIPVLWRENYHGFANFKFNELNEIFYQQCKLFLSNAFEFRALAFSEIKKYWKKVLIHQAKPLVHQIDNQFAMMPAGIRAQLLNKKTNKLEMDFIFEKTKRSLHVLNAVSPAFTCAFSIAKHLVSNHLL